MTIVNTVNCVGVMGAGIAYECRLRYPNMYRKYVGLCNDGLIKIGSLWLYKGEDRWILNFPTKYHWKYPSKTEYLKLGLQKFMDTYKEKGITSIAFPLLGASHGGIPENESMDIIKSYLVNCDIPVEVYHYDENAYDDLYLNFKRLWYAIPEKELALKSGLRIDFVRKVKYALENDSIRSLSRLISVKGIGDITLEKAFLFLNNYLDESNLYNSNLLD